MSCRLDLIKPGLTTCERECEQNISKLATFGQRREYKWNKKFRVNLWAQTVQTGVSHCHDALIEPNWVWSWKVFSVYKHCCKPYKKQSTLYSPPLFHTLIYAKTHIKIYESCSKIWNMIHKFWTKWSCICQQSEDEFLRRLMFQRELPHSSEERLAEFERW